MNKCEHYKFQTSALESKERVPGLSVTKRDIVKVKRYYCDLHIKETLHSNEKPAFDCKGDRSSPDCLENQ